jgi:hypothetical protein
VRIKLKKISIEIEEFKDILDKKYLREKRKRME